MTTPTYNDANFRAQFPAFQNSITFPPASLSGWWTMGAAYISDQNSNAPGASWSDQQAQLANDLMCAHLTSLFTQIGAGQTPGLMTAASEGSVSVTLQPPPTATGFQHWLSQTPYGQQLRALLRAVAGPGLFVGGLPERSGFRKIGGVF